MYAPPSGALDPARCQHRCSHLIDPAYQCERGPTHESEDEPLHVARPRRNGKLTWKTGGTLDFDQAWWDAYREKDTAEREAARFTPAYRAWAAENGRTPEEQEDYERKFPSAKVPWMKRNGRAMYEWKVAVIACGARKQATHAPARELYTGPLFRSAMAHASAPGRYDQIVIISGMHGALRADDMVAPYELWLAKEMEGYQREWGRRTAQGLDALTHSADRHRLLTFLAPALYCDLVIPYLTSWSWTTPASWRTPLRGLGIGEQRAKLGRLT